MAKIDNYDVPLDLNDINTCSLISQIKPESQVLEFGPAMGRLTRYMKEELHCRIYIVELDRTGFENAVKYAEKGLQGDIETLAWENEFPQDSFDYVIFADVLEHLKNPSKVLERVYPLLKENGKLLSSIPNIAYAGVVEGLLRNQFRYRNTGLLDDSHIRFFSWENIMNLYKNSNYFPIIMKGYPNEVNYSEFAEDRTVLPLYITQYLEDRPWALNYQYFTLALKQDYYQKNVNLYKLDIDEPIIKELSSSLYYNTGSGYNEGEKIVNHMLQGRDCNISFVLPLVESFVELRWDPAIGRSFHCYNVFLVNSGKVLYPIQNSAAFIYEEKHYFIGQDSWYVFPGEELTSGDVTIHYSLCIDYKSEETIILEKSLHEQILEKNLHEQMLENSLREQMLEIQTECDTQVTRLRQSIKDAEENLDHVNKRNSKLMTALYTSVQEVKESNNLSLDQALQQQQQQQQQQQLYIQQLENNIKMITSSTAWKSTFPIRYVLDKLKAFMAPKASALEIEDKVEKDSCPLILTPNIAQEGEPTLADVKVSFIIPTYNGGSDIKELLGSLLSQKGLGKIEVIVVDSGSTDETPQVAEYLGAKVIKIRSEDFSHSFARNVGAKNASGEYFIFMTQDALPTGNWWARRMLEPLLNGIVVAASCIELPKPGADLNAQILNWCHYKWFMCLDGQDRIGSLPKVQNYQSLRYNANLSDVACAVCADVFLKLRYRGNYAEDLEFGLRAIRKGYNIGFLWSEQIIHSHNRPAYYFLKRAYLEWITLIEILPDYPMSMYTPSLLISEVVQGSMERYELNSFISKMTEEELSVDNFQNQIHNFLRIQELLPCEDLTEREPETSGDLELDKFIRQTWRFLDHITYEASSLIPRYRSHVEDTICPYLRAKNLVVTKKIRADICNSITIFQASLIGMAMAAYVIEHDERDNIFDHADQLKGGV